MLVGMQPLAPWIVTTCMGRRAHLEQTLPAALRNGDVGVVLVDYSCPQASGQWARTAFPAEVATGRLRVVEVRGETTFHKTQALNLGARDAIAAGASHLCFVDADTHLLPGFGTWLLKQLAEAPTGSIFISALTSDRREVAELYGFLLLETALFEQAGGYAGRFVGWGCEDLEMRLRLVLKHSATVREVPLELLAFIQHPFDLRSAHYTTKDWSTSNSKNLLELERLVHSWTGRALRDLEGPARRLTMQHHPAIFVDGKPLQHFAPLPVTTAPGAG